MRTTGLLTLAVAMTLTAGGAQAAPQKWAKIRTTAGFSIDQPVGWTSVAVSPDQIDIVSRGCRQPGVVICGGEAQIAVRSEVVVVKPKAIKSTACWSLEQTLSETVEPGGRRLQASAFTCIIGARRFVIIERHWKGDKRSASYGRIAIRMAKSLRYPA